MLSILVRLRRPTVWAPGAIPADEVKYAGPLKRVVFPLFDVALIVAGFYAVRSGIPSLDQLLPDRFSDALAYTFVLCAFGALLGIVYPALWAVEMIGKVLLVGILGMYFLALRTLAGPDGNRDFISALVLAIVPWLLFRLWIIGVELRKRLDSRARRREGGR